MSSCEAPDNGRGDVIRVVKYDMPLNKFLVKELLTNPFESIIVGKFDTEEEANTYKEELNVQN